MVLALILAIAPQRVAAGQQTVSGRVTNELTDEPLAGVRLRIFYNLNPYGTIEIGAPVTDADGRYSWTGSCPEDSSPVQCIVDVLTDGFLDAYELFTDLDGNVTFDFALIPGATVSGTFTIDGGIADRPIDASIEYLNENPEYWTTPIALTFEQADGHYTFGRLPYGHQYRVCAGGIEAGVVRQCWNGHEQASVSSAPLYDVFGLAEGEHRDGIDFSLRSGGAIEGTVHDGYRDVPLADLTIWVSLFGEAGSFGAYVMRTTDANGVYRLAGLPDGHYYVEIQSVLGVFADGLQIYPGIICANGECGPVTDGQQITIANGATAGGIDFTLHPDVVIGGRVTDAATGAGVGGIHVFALQDYLPRTISEADTGAYQVYASHGSVRVFTNGSQPLIDQVYPGIPCAYNDCWWQGQPLETTSGGIYEGIDFALTLGASITGNMTDKATGLPLVGYVDLFDANFTRIWSGWTDESGYFATGAWLPGTYYAKAVIFPLVGLVCTFYDARPCPDDGVDPATVTPTPIVLSLGEVRGGIDFTVSDAIFASGFDF
jgi:hypothetical protein